MTFYDIFTYLCTFTIIIPLAVFCLFPVIDHLKTPIRHLLIKISLVFVCYFALLIIPYMIFQQNLGNILIFLAAPVFFYLFQKETNLMLPASLFVMLTACLLFHDAHFAGLCISSIYLILCYHPQLCRKSVYVRRTKDSGDSGKRILPAFPACTGDKRDPS